MSHPKGRNKVEQEKNDVNTQETVEPDNPETSKSQPMATEQPQEPEIGSKEYNFRQLEEKHKKEKETDRLEKEQYQRKILELEEKQKTAVKEPDDELNQLQADDLITMSQHQKLTQKEAREIVQEELRKAEQAKQPLVAKQKYPDFENIVTSENIEKLKKEDPELERLIMLSNNPYERTYKEIKRSDFYRSTQVNKESEEKIAENSKKPISSNSFGKSRPLSYANDYAKGDASLYEEMLKYKGGSL